VVEAYDKEKIGKDRYIGGGTVSVADQMRQPSTSGTDFAVPLLTKAGKEAGTIRLEAIFAPTAPPSSSAAAGAKRDASLRDRILRKLRAASYTKSGQDHSKLFQLFDVNHDGSLTVDELASGLRKMTSVTDEEMDTVIGWFDDDHNGLIDMHEFVGLLQHEDAEQQQYHHDLVNPQRPSSPAASGGAAGGGGGGAGSGDQHTLAPDYAKAADLLRGTDARAAALLSRAAANQAAGQAVGQKVAGRAPALDNIYRAKSVNLLGRAARYRERKKKLQLTPAEQKALLDRVVHKLRGASYGIHGQDATGLFRMFDVNHDNELSLAELSRGIKKLIKVSSEELDVIMQSVDVNSDGVVNVEEFVAFLRPANAGDKAATKRVHDEMQAVLGAKLPAFPKGFSPKKSLEAQSRRLSGGKGGAKKTEWWVGDGRGNVGSGDMGKARPTPDFAGGPRGRVFGGLEESTLGLQEMGLLERVVRKLQGASYGKGSIHGQDAVGLFRHFDVNHDNELSLEELSRGIKKLIKVSSEELDVIMRSVDVNSDGVVNVEEFVAFLGSLKGAAKGSPKSPGRKNSKDPSGSLESSLGSSPSSPVSQGAAPFYTPFADNDALGKADEADEAGREADMARETGKTSSSRSSATVPPLNFAGIAGAVHEEDSTAPEGLVQRLHRVQNVDTTTARTVPVVGQLAVVVRRGVGLKNVGSMLHKMAPYVKVEAAWAMGSWQTTKAVVKGHSSPTWNGPSTPSGDTLVFPFAAQAQAVAAARKCDTMTYELQVEVWDKGKTPGKDRFIGAGTALVSKQMLRHEELPLDVEIEVQLMTRPKIPKASRKGKASKSKSKPSQAAGSVFLVATFVPLPASNVESPDSVASSPCSSSNESSEGEDSQGEVMSLAALAAQPLEGGSPHGSSSSIHSSTHGSPEGASPSSPARHVSFKEKQSPASPAPSSSPLSLSEGEGTGGQVQFQDAQSALSHDLFGPGGQAEKKQKGWQRARAGTGYRRAPPPPESDDDVGEGEGHEAGGGSAS
jgi:Ca2+-binding EF-hand superfamily protein